MGEYPSKRYRIHSDDQQHTFVSTTSRKSGLVHLISTTLLACGVTLCWASSACHAATLADWTSGDGVWSDPGSWSTNPIVPNNTSTDTFDVTISHHTVTLDQAITINTLDFCGEELILDDALNVQELTVDGGTVKGEGAIHVATDVILRSGAINNTARDGGFYVGGTVYKRGFGSATLAPFSRDGTYPIVIEQGSLTTGNGGEGTADAGIHIANREYARLVFHQIGSPHDDLYLNNAGGYLGSGSIYALDSAWLFSDIYLGSIGATIGSDDFLRMEGKIHGGDLTLAGDGTFRLRTAGHTYTGATILNNLMQNRSGAELKLELEGSITNSSGIVIGHGAAVTADNEDASIADRLPDCAPITLSGGTLRVVQNDTTYVTEHAGPVTLTHGTSIIDTNSRGYDDEVLLVIDSLERQNKSVIDFEGVLNVTDSPLLLIEDTPVLENGIIGPWAVTSGTDFATYDPQLGVMPLRDYDNRPDQIDTSGPTDNVLSRGQQQVLTADREVYSLAIHLSGDSGIDLGGHLLNIVSGGFVRSPGYTRVSNGNLTAGGDADQAELIIHHMRSSYGSTDLRIEADIVDNPSGGSVELIKSGDGPLRLSGNNTYTGPTTVNNGQLIIENPTALPSGTDLTISGGNLELQYASSTPVQVGSVHLQSGYLLSTESDTTLEATSYLLESGNISVALMGNAPVVKSTQGLVEFRQTSPGFTGDVTIEQGAIGLRATDDLTADRRALGTGLITVLPGGTLIHANRSVSSQPQIAGLDANLHLAGGDVGLGIRTGYLGWSFGGNWRVSDGSRLLMFDVTGDRDDFIPLIQVEADVVIDNSATFEVLGQGTVYFAGNFMVPDQATIVLPEGTARYNHLNPGSSHSVLQLRGEGTHVLGNTLQGDTDRVLEVILNEGTHAGFVNGFGRIKENAILNLNGEVHVTQLFLDGGVLTGTGTVNRLINSSGTISPGNSLGTLHITEHLTQEADGQLFIEISGGPDQSADQLIVDTALIGGTIMIHPMDHAQILPGNFYDLVVANDITTETINLVFDAPGYEGLLSIWDFEDGPRSGMQSLRLTVTQVPEPLTFCYMVVLAAGLKRQR